MLTPLFFLQPVNVKKSETLAKIANIHEENLHIFWRTWRILIKFARKISLMIILKFTKNQGLTLSLENTILEKPKFGSNWTPSPSLFSIKSFVWLCFWNYFLPLYIIPLESFTLCVFFLSKVSKKSILCLEKFLLCLKPYLRLGTGHLEKMYPLQYFNCQNYQEREQSRPSVYPLPTTVFENEKISFDNTTNKDRRVRSFQERFLHNLSFTTLQLVIQLLCSR